MVQSGEGGPGASPLLVVKEQGTGRVVVCLEAVEG